MRQGMQIPFSANLSFSTKFSNMGTLRTNHDAWEFVHSRIPDTNSLNVDSGGMLCWSRMPYDRFPDIYSIELVPPSAYTQIPLQRKRTVHVTLTG